VPFQNQPSLLPGISTPSPDMSSELKIKLDWFLKNLKLLLEDYDLKQQGKTIELYFDTHEIKHTIMGLYAFYDKSESLFNIQKAFRVEEAKPLKDRTLVLCLAFSGRLGPIKMLPPHQAEFLASLNKDFGLDELRDAPGQLVRRFMKEVGQAGAINVRQDSVPLEEMDDKQALMYVRRHAGKAINFFKIIQLIRGATWQGRLSSLRKSRILQLDSQEVDYDRIIRSEIFKTLRQRFTEHRPRYNPVSNFADAVALTILSQHVEDFNEGRTGVVSRIFTATESPGERPLFSAIIAEAKLGDVLSYRTDDKEWSGVLREADYFVFKSTFQPAAGGGSGDEFTNPDELRDLHDRISRIIQTPALITPEHVEQIEVSGRSLIQVIDDLNTFLFFTNVWMPASEQEEEIALGDLERAADELKSDAFVNRVDEEIQITKKSLERNVNEYQVISTLWEQIEKATRNLRRHVSEDFAGNIDYFRDFGLLRFAFPETAHQRINGVLETLLSGDKESEQLTHYDVIKACYLAHFAPDTIYTDNLAAAASVFWVAEMYPQLISLLGRIEPRPHYSLDIIYAAAIFETNQGEEVGVVILNKLYERYVSTTNTKEKADLAVGLAYLHFHLLTRRGYEPAWDRPGNSTVTVDEDSRDFLNRAIQLAKDAYDLLDEQDMKKKLYALNQYLYYMVMGDDDTKLPEIYKVADELLRYRDNNEFWQHRFDDTLAHVFHRAAVSATNEQDWNNNISSAVGYARAASNRAPWDQKMNTYLGRLVIKKEEGFRPIV
jgi:hypothetical protein